MSSTIDINKVREWCGKEFTAHKCSIRFCSKRCSEHFYKALRRRRHVDENNAATLNKVRESRKHIDNALAGKQPTETVAEEWYSVEEVCAKFNMSKEAVYRFVSERKIGKRKDKCKIFYSRRQFDKAMGIESELEPEYYTMPEAMARYNMTRDQISHYVRAHDIPRSYEGRYERIDCKALDALFALLKIG